MFADGLEFQGKVFKWKKTAGFAVYSEVAVRQPERATALEA
jgi:hypothetical protein